MTDSSPVSQSQSSAHGYGQYGPLEDGAGLLLPRTSPWLHTVEYPLVTQSAPAAGAVSIPAAVAATTNAGVT
jgi:hypothetical protein